MPPPAGGRLHPRSDTREAALRTLVGDIMSRNVTCVRERSSLESARKLLTERGVLGVLVVDAETKLRGLVARADLVRAPAREDARVEDVMTRDVHALPEDAPVALAIGLMAVERVHAVPIVGDDRVVVGIVTALEVLRWVAGELGYVLPREQETPEEKRP
jgi:CBS domain-containing protein